MTRSRKRGKENRYERAVRRQMAFRSVDHRYAPVEQFLRRGDTRERFQVTADGSHDQT